MCQRKRPGPGGGGRRRIQCILLGSPLQVKEYDATVHRLTDERGALPSGADPPDDLQTYVTAISELEARRCTPHAARHRTHTHAGSRTPSARARRAFRPAARARVGHARSPALAPLLS